MKETRIVTVIVVLFLGLLAGQAMGGVDDLNCNATGCTAGFANTAYSLAPGASLPDSLITPAKLSFYNNTAVVAPTGGDYALPTDAMASLGSWCPSTPCLLKLKAGWYNIGTNTLTMQQFVDIEGEGQDLTVIVGNSDGLPTITGASNSEIRFLQVLNNGGSGNSSAIGISSTGTNVSITNVIVSASGAAVNHAVENHGNSGNGLTPTLTNVRAWAQNLGVPNPANIENIGVLNDGNSSATLVNVNASGFGGPGLNIGMKNYGAVTVKDSVIGAWGGATSIGIHNNGFTGQLLNLIVGANGATTTTGILNENNNGGRIMDVLVTAGNTTGTSTTNIGILNQTGAKPVMRNIRAEGSGGTTSIGVKNDGCGPGAMSMTSISGIGHNATGSNYGFYNNSCSPVMFSVYAYVLPGTAGAAHYGIYNDASSPRIQSSLIQTPEDLSSCGGGCYGVDNVTSGTTAIDNSAIYSYHATVLSGNSATLITKIGNTKLAGGAPSKGASSTMNCFGTYNDAYTSVTCP